MSVSMALKWKVMHPINLVSVVFNLEISLSRAIHLLAWKPITGVKLNPKNTKPVSPCFTVSLCSQASSSDLHIDCTCCVIKIKSLKDMTVATTTSGKKNTIKPFCPDRLSDSHTLSNYIAHSAFTLHPYCLFPLSGRSSWPPLTPPQFAECLLTLGINVRVQKGKLHPAIKSSKSETHTNKFFLTVPFHLAFHTGQII